MLNEIKQLESIELRNDVEAAYLEDMRLRKEIVEGGDNEAREITTKSR